MMSTDTEVKKAKDTPVWSLAFVGDIAEGSDRIVASGPWIKHDPMVPIQVVDKKIFDDLQKRFKKYSEGAEKHLRENRLEIFKMCEESENLLKPFKLENRKLKKLLRKPANAKLIASKLRMQKMRQKLISDRKAITKAKREIKEAQKQIQRLTKLAKKITAWR
jgi:Mg2+ and Co2+ transporter CorA